ncbi:MAG: GNAT family N-acetyltransferase [Candidatus Cloacimonetes bacterium]|nr:GNAT family N-acetyltransferase [Candidatus Cloacimonadota bacterium]
MRVFFRQITTDIKVSITIPQYAEELYKLTENNREFLKKWLPWLDNIHNQDDTNKFLQHQLSRFQKSEGVPEIIFYKGKIAGVLDFNKIDHANGIGHIGYWLAKDYNGHGIMTQVVTDLIKLGFEYYSMQKVEIHCAVKNIPSRAIPERLGFKNEGVIRQAEKLYDRYVDHVVYGLLRDEFKC